MCCMGKRGEIKKSVPHSNSKIQIQMTKSGWVRKCKGKRINHNGLSLIWVYFSNHEHLFTFLQVTDLPLLPLSRIPFKILTHICNFNHFCCTSFLRLGDTAKLKIVLQRNQIQ